MVMVYGIQLALDGGRLFGIVAAYGSDRAAARMVDEQQHRRMQMVYAVFDRTFGCGELVADIAHHE